VDARHDGEEAAARRTPALEAARQHIEALGHLELRVVRIELACRHLLAQALNRMCCHAVRVPAIVTLWARLRARPQPAATECHSLDARWG
jgi:hypothetical protein